MEDMKGALKKAGYKNQGGYRDSVRGVTAPVAPKIAFRGENNKRRRELFTKDAKEWANLLYGVSDTQLRNFYNQVKALQAKIEAEGFEKNDALIGLLKPKAAYALARAEKRNKKKFEYLQVMIEQGVDHSASPESFEDFVLFFESVLGFYKGGRR